MRRILYLFLLILVGCSQKKVDGDWMDRALDRDFKRFSAGISKERLEESWKACKKYKEFQRFQVIGSHVYGPEGRIKTLLEEMVVRYPVPDVDFIYYYEDRLKPSFFKRSKHRNSAPIFVSAKNKSLERVILFADWNYDVRDQTSGWNFLIQKVNEIHAKRSWAEKVEKLFWKGTPWDGKHFGMYDFNNWTTIPRGRLVAESRKYPDLIDATFSEYPFKCATQDLGRCIREMGVTRFLSWEEMLSFKYQMAIDGVTCSFPATQWKLLSASLVFKQESDDIQYYYDELIPWTHYVPVKQDLSDLREKIGWAKEHDSEAQKIAEQGRQFALTHLMPEHILEYCYRALKRYAALQTFTPTRESN